jgi:HAD superfamily hydrolase (TIGR01509 family)
MLSAFNRSDQRRVDLGAAMSKLKALIFDVDGTLSDTERDGHRVAFNRAFVDAGLDWDWGVELYGDLLSVTGGKERLTYYLERYRPDFQPPEPVAEFVADLHAAKTKHYLDILAEHGIPLRPGVERLLTKAREAGLRLAIATTTTPANVTALLESVLPGKLDWFDVIGAGDVVPAKKPAPDIYRYVLNELRLGPDECLAFEDSELGLRSSLGAGLKTIVTVNPYTIDQHFSGAALVIDNLGEPTQPIGLLAGDGYGSTYVDVRLLYKFFESK